jgi:uncharacterized membrane protein YeiB
MGIIEEINPSKMGKYPIDFTLPYALFFGISCVVFAVIWTKYQKSGPLEWVMRKLTDKITLASRSVYHGIFNE